MTRQGSLKERRLFFAACFVCSAFKDVLRLCKVICWCYLVQIYFGSLDVL